MEDFNVGFILGCILRNHILKLGLGIISNGIKFFHSIKNHRKKEISYSKIINIDLIVKVKNVENITKSDKRYFQEKGIFKMKLSDDLLKYCNNNFEYLDLKVSDVCDLAYKETGGYNSMSKLGEVYLYFTYLDDSRKFINFYADNDIINTRSFEVNYDLKFKNMICATVTFNSKIEYITKYFKMFLNNKNLTLETLLLDYDNLNVNLLNTELLITYQTSNEKYSITDKII
jgi:hypothetical protein